MEKRTGPWEETAGKDGAEKKNGGVLWKRLAVMVCVGISAVGVWWVAKERMAKASVVFPPGEKVGDTMTITLPGGEPMEMVYVAPGSFMMGSENGLDNEKPVHKVTLGQGFWMGKYEVTQAQWKSVMGENPSSFKGDDRPVENVTWHDCQKFIGKVNAMLGPGAVRLPTEAEWEYACRAGTTGDYGGTGQLDDMGWHRDNSGKETHPVGRKKANGWGFHDMHGNVWEWCSDWYGGYARRDVADPTGPASGESRVLRGGSWYFHAPYCCSAFRIRNFPENRNFSYGLRLVCSAGPCE